VGQFSVATMGHFWVAIYNSELSVTP